MRAKAVEEGEKRNEPSRDCNFRSFSHSSPVIPSKLWSRVVGTLCIMSLGILFIYSYIYIYMTPHTLQTHTRKQKQIIHFFLSTAIDIINISTLAIYINKIQSHFCLPLLDYLVFLWNCGKKRTEKQKREKCVKLFIYLFTLWAWYLSSSRFVGEQESRKARRGWASEPSQAKKGKPLRTLSACAPDSHSPASLCSPWKTTFLNQKTTTKSMSFSHIKKKQSLLYIPLRHLWG